MANFLKTLLLLMAVAGPGNGPVMAQQEGAAQAVTFRTETMGTVGSLTLVTADSASVADLAYEALLSFHHTDSLMTNWTKISEVARINRLAGSETVTIAPEVNDVLELAGIVGAESSGLFDLTVEPLVRLWGFLEGTPRVPDQTEIDAVLSQVGWENIEHDVEARSLRFTDPETKIDLGGIAKGWGVDRVRMILVTAGVTDALINLSGNMVALGGSADSEVWTLGIMDPEKKHDFLGTIRLSGQAVATSGNYMQYVIEPNRDESRKFGHIINPRTGWPAEGFASATVVADKAAVADAWATAFIVMDPWTARRIAREREDLTVIFVEQSSADLQVMWIEEPLRENFVRKEGLEERVKVLYF